MTFQPSDNVYWKALLPRCVSKCRHEAIQPKSASQCEQPAALPQAATIRRAVKLLLIMHLAHNSTQPEPAAVMC